MNVAMNKKGYDSIDHVMQRAHGRFRQMPLRRRPTKPMR